MCAMILERNPLRGVLYYDHMRRMEMRMMMIMRIMIEDHPITLQRYREYYSTTSIYNPNQVVVQRRPIARPWGAAHRPQRLSASRLTPHASRERIANVQQPLGEDDRLLPLGIHPSRLFGLPNASDIQS